MPNIAIRVENLSKRYRIGLKEQIYDTFAGSIVGLTTRPFKNLRRLRRLSTFRDGHEDAPDIIWALNDVSFEIQQGEVVGIIGPNGAGKSTLLKVLSKITEPTSGRAVIRGRVSTLLEVGTGFHPELTGRENVFLNGAVLGMTRKEIEHKFDQIVDFSGVGRFIDTPVKRFSSGMQVRLAFSVAAFLEPEILMVDEVLAVGDADFQKKSIAKMEEVGKEGRTVVFVSHNMNAIRRFCTRGILIRDGVIRAEGSIDLVVESYLGSAVNLDRERTWEDISRAPGDDVVRLLGIRLKGEGGQVRSECDVREQVGIEFDFVVLREGYQLCARIDLSNETGERILASLDNYVSGPWGVQHSYDVGRYRSSCIIPGDLLNEGELQVNLRMFSPPGDPGLGSNSHIYELGILRFAVTDEMKPGGVRGSYPYVWGSDIPLRPRLRWTTQSIPDSDVPSSG